MNTYKVTYSGKNSRYQDFEELVNAHTERDAVEDVYASRFTENYFPDEDGSIRDCDGNIIAEADDDTIDYDGGYFLAELI